MKESLRQAVIQELRKGQEQFTPTPDIDVVWAISGPGTVLESPPTGLYQDRFPDLERFEFAVYIVIAVTALRLGIETSAVTKADLIEHGPILFYNGEDQDNGTFPQNEDVAALIKKPWFPLPEEKVVIQRLTEANTLGQVQGLIDFLARLPSTRKVVVVTHAPQSKRVGRYLEKYQNQFAPTIQFVEACVPEKIAPVGAVLTEIKKIIKYALKGDLAEKSLF